MELMWGVSFLNSKKGTFSLLFTQQAQRALHTESKDSIAAAIAFSQISPEKKMIELGAIMAPFCKWKKANIIWMRSKQSFPSTCYFIWGIKACKKKKKKSASYSLWSLPPTEESRAKQCQEKGKSEKIVLKLLYVIAIFVLGDYGHKFFWTHLDSWQWID